ncbi:MAG TPA: NACHT domain-containing protein, partial [Desulfosporosinus sp.]|nr:NACHT domain-containing protein [Desulfosporosinus sp.]
VKSLDVLREGKKKIKKWILVTPQDPVESTNRKSKGDVTWFSGLKEKHSLNFEIEHWGHTHLQSLFIETPAIGLYYYPELFPDGHNRSKTIKELRIQYDKALKNEHGRIEFVGMSVYKQEAARTVPMEDIYIPLSVIPNDSDELDHTVPRQNPLELLSPGTRHIILGDPGSGKTTLLRFLALVGRSQVLQERYNRVQSDANMPFQEDVRLPIFITLRRYADELKKDDNLSLIEYIRANISADFSIADITLDFLEYHLETGGSILLFDGLDELPNPEFKQKIRNRIQNLGENYPGNTILVTSRIFGYQGVFNFDQNSYVHHRLAKLGIKEIEHFVHDWYNVRVESQKESKDYMESLISILQNEDHEAILDLARNPLLLTIMVLVHRIDAVLPDERHVLYQKCIETLLNTWHTWKFHEKDRLHRAKVDRLNMQRMQAVAYWMQQRMGSSESGRQAVVTYEDLHQELTRHINEERPPNNDYAADDIATAFIEFVQDRAGLLVEIGDRQFSFLHLTFQEYLTAGHIKTIMEPHSLEDTWKKQIAPHCIDPRWREVIRLLVSGYGANQSQEILVDRMLSLKSSNVSLLLAGLYLDGVAAAQMVLERIFVHLLKSIVETKEQPLIAEQLSYLRSCLVRDSNASSLLENAVHTLCVQNLGEDVRTKIRLTLLVCGLPLESIWKLCGKGTRREDALISLFFSDSVIVDIKNEMYADFDFLQMYHDAILLFSIMGNFLAVLDWKILEKSHSLCYQRIFISLLSTLVY